MTLGKRGADLIKSYEKLRLTAYLPTPNDRWTIGWGHTRGVVQGMTCTPAQAETWFREDTARAERTVNRVEVPLTQSMFDALVSLVYNTGTLGTTIPKHLRNRSYFTAWAGIALWRKQAGRDLLGLARRRAREMVLFLEDGLP